MAKSGEEASLRIGLLKKTSSVLVSNGAKKDECCEKKDVLPKMRPLFLQGTHKRRWHLKYSV